MTLPDSDSLASPAPWVVPFVWSDAYSDAWVQDGVVYAMIPGGGGKDFVTPDEARKFAAAYLRAADAAEAGVNNPAPVPDEPVRRRWFGR